MVVVGVVFAVVNLFSKDEVSCARSAEFPARAFALSCELKKIEAMIEPRANAIGAVRHSVMPLSCSIFRINVSSSPRSIWSKSRANSMETGLMVVMVLDVELDVDVAVDDVVVVEVVVLELVLDGVVETDVVAVMVVVVAVVAVIAVAVVSLICGVTVEAIPAKAWQSVSQSALPSQCRTNFSPRKPLINT